MLNFPDEKPTTILVHPSLVEELKERQRIFFEETGRKNNGGLTTFSRLASLELRAMRLSGDELFKEIKRKHKDIKKYMIIEDGTQYVPFELYKNLYIFASALSKKKDQKQIKVEIAKIKGIQKNEINILW